MGGPVALYPSSPRTEQPAAAPAAKAPVPVAADGWGTEQVMPYPPERNGGIRAFETVATTDVPATPRRNAGDLFVDAVSGANKVLEAVAKKLEGPAPRLIRSPCAARRGGSRPTPFLPPVPGERHALACSVRGERGAVRSGEALVHRPVTTTTALIAGRPECAGGPRQLPLPGLPRPRFAPVDPAVAAGMPPPADPLCRPLWGPPQTPPRAIRPAAGTGVRARHAGFSAPAPRQPGRCQWRGSGTSGPPPRRGSAGG